MTESPSELSVRKATTKDAEAVSRLFYETVRRVNARDYTVEEIAVWAPQVLPPSRWLDRWTKLEVWVARIEGEVVGFAELRPSDGYVDCFYVHWNHLRRGVGAALLVPLRHASSGKLWADVSVTAKPFFEKQGFRVVKEKFRETEGQRFRQFQMEWVSPHG